MGPAHTDDPSTVERSYPRTDVAEGASDDSGPARRRGSGVGVVVLWVLLLAAGVGGAVAYAQLADEDADPLAVDEPADTTVSETTVVPDATAVPDVDQAPEQPATQEGLASLVGDEATVEGVVARAIGTDAVVIDSERFGSVLVLRAGVAAGVGDAVAAQGRIERFDFEDAAAMFAVERDRAELEPFEGAPIVLADAVEVVQPGLRDGDDAPTPGGGGG